jgi:hypothetical protein
MSVKQVFNTSAELDYPTVLPTLDLDFANSKTLDPRITFTRASGGSYVGADGLIKYSGVNEARFDHDPETGESLGLLIEEARTNLFERTEEFDNAYWSKGNSSVVKADIPAPDGSGNAYLFRENTTINTTFTISKFLSYESGFKYSFSVFAKAYGSGNRKLFMLFGAGAFPSQQNATFDLVNGVVEGISVGNGTEARIEKYSNGWYKCTLIGTTTTSAANSTSILYLHNGTTVFYPGDGQSGIYIWGAQVERGSFPTSYIPTQASTRTRAADNASITGKNFSEWYRQDEGSIFIDFLNTPNSATFPTIYSFYDPITGAGQNRVQLVKFSEVYNIRITDVSNGLTQSAYNIASDYKVFDNIKVFRTYGFKNYIGSVNGTTPRPPGTFNVTNPTPSKLISALNIGSGENGSAPINAPVKRFTYYSKALPPSNLQALTS